MQGINVLFYPNRRTGDTPETERPITCEIHYRVNGERKRFKFSTGQSCKLRHFRDGRVWHSVSFATQINDRLHEIRDKAERIYRDSIERKTMPTPERFRDLILREAYEVKPERDFLQDFDAFIEYHINKSTTIRTIKNLRRTKVILIDIARKERYALTYETMNLDFYGRFVKYLYNIKGRFTEKMRHNTVGGYIKRIKMFLEWANRCGYNPSTFFREFPSVSERSSNHYLTQEELDLLLNLDLSRKPALARDRDWFLLACLTGMRISDYPQLRRGNIDEVRDPKTGETVGYNFRYYPNKTSKSSGARPVVPLTKTAVRILVRHGWDLPHIPEEPVFRRNLKKIADMAGVVKDIKPHDARRTFATLEYLAGTPTQYIMQITGHRTEQIFRRYLCLDAVENADFVRQMHPDRFKVTEPGLKDNYLRIA
jgi:integrase